jgi:hypothetical protein
LAEERKKREERRAQEKKRIKEAMRFSAIPLQYLRLGGREDI